VLFFPKLTPEQMAACEAILPRPQAGDEIGIDFKRQAYNRWHKMMRRCYNERDQAFKNYGGRGIKVCEAWHSFDAYYAETGSPPEPTFTLDRIDNDGDYAPGNVRWASKALQGQNRRLANKSKPSILSIHGRFRAQIRVQIARTFDTEAEALAWAEAVGDRIAQEAAT
jgi:hypothetical protein